ncbi:hypothetical protein F5876DRAFT_69782 [Lentinula aff. lateritia]|uniref:Uncharacterized protein n=1 Tax=Lentinula aff. lateritia TaxID=2804960 RepID=A0ACC1TLA4_9AGAR|nr:hypothetical protein F5876DRAFT_69782 [Lentinula aff. lateritia]
MSKQRASSTPFTSPSSSNGRLKVQLVAQPSREVREFESLLLLKDRALEDMNDELDELMNCDSERVKFLEEERKQVFQDKTIAEIKAERLQHRVVELETELHNLKLCNAQVVSVERPTAPHGAEPVAVSVDRSIAPTCEEYEVKQVVVRAKCPTATTDESHGVKQFNAVNDLPNNYPPGDTTLSRTPFNGETSASNGSCIELPVYPEDALKSDNARRWFPSAFGYLNQDISEEYAGLLRIWVEFERTRDWASSNKGLDRRERPKVLSKWITNCRYERSGNEPDLTKKEDLVQFSKSFTRWWDNLRRPQSSAETSAHDTHKGWQSLDRSGKNGWLGVLACLKWWGMALTEKDKSGPLGDEWRNMIKDASLVLSELTKDR